MNKLQLLKHACNIPINLTSDNLIPKKDIVKKSLVVVIAIMCFLCTSGFACIYLLNRSVTNWNKNIGGEATIEVTPIKGHDIEADLKAASELAINFAGIYDTEILSEKATKQLVEPWLGKNANFKDLPIPRIIILHLNEDKSFDANKFNSYLTKAMPNCIFNNNHAWITQLQNMAYNCTIIVSFIVLLLCSSLVISIIFATLSAVSANKHIIEILHFLTADKSYITKQFDVVFFYKAVQGSFAGALTTLILFSALHYFNITNHNYHIQLAAFFGDFKLGILYYIEMLILVFMVICLTMLACRITVLKKLYALETEV